MTIVAAQDEVGVATRGPVAWLTERFEAVRRQTEALCLPLETEDYVVRSMPDASPTKWHLAHTSWFFETFVLVPHCSRYTPLDPAYAFLFNSYYVQAGERHCRAQRGLVTRPTVQQVYVYRAYVDAHVRRLLEEIGGRDSHPALSLIELGLHHEQQHQELILTDLKHLFWTNPIKPSYHASANASGRHASREVPELRWRSVAAGLQRIGHEGEGGGFVFDNEGPAHHVYLNDYRLASRLVTNGEYLAFIEAGGYRNPTLWLDSGWATVRERGWEAPLYWTRAQGEWMEFTLAGERPLDRAEPVCHVSYYEADAFARWAGYRLPTEAEWEVVATAPTIGGGVAPSAALHPTALSDAHGEANENAEVALVQLYGDVWQWTQSPYVAYPGYVATKDAIGEYNGKWMCDQWVLRGASCVTPSSHARRTYRNFFAADARWQFSGIRLARDGV
jgi:ergothioneine biosynthesis protein EgtB